MEKRGERAMDKILIKDLRLRCIIGINEFERREKQDVTINVVIWSNFTEAARTDDIRKTVDYKEITKGIIKLVEGSEFCLVETLAEKIAESCLEHARVKKVRVTVEKPGALRFARSVGVSIIRKED
ncbi:MAG TPA: dihydroneopterin aldolase [candidate division Zixibacteria bacterium]|nr:dihydroneopterin aldolase [candidate division Zixibacteria bacterium]